MKKTLAILLSVLLLFGCFGSIGIIASAATIESTQAEYDVYANDPNITMGGGGAWASASTNRPNDCYNSIGWVIASPGTNPQGFMQLTFKGTGVAFYAAMGSSNSKGVKIYIDGVEHGTMDTSLPVGSSNTKCTTPYTVKGLAFGEHTIKVERGGSGTYLIPNMFRIFNYSANPTVEKVEVKNDKVVATFSDSLDEETATDISNYNINGVDITAATLNPETAAAPGRKVVELTVDGLEQGKSYTFSASSVQNYDKTRSANLDKTFTVAEPTMYGHYKLDETSGTVADDFAGTNDGTINGTMGFVAGKYNGAYSFSPANKTAITLPTTSKSVFTSQEFAAMGWFKPSATNGSGVIFSQGETFKLNFNVGSVGTVDQSCQLTFTLNGKDSDSTRTLIPFDQWSHIAVVRAIDEVGRSSIVVYVNGCPHLGNSGYDLQTANNNPLIIGGVLNGSTYSNFYNGLADDIKIFSQAVSEDFVGKEYRVGAGIDYTVTATNGSADIIFANAPAVAPTLNDFRLFFTRHNDFRMAMPKTNDPNAVTNTRITGFSYNAAAKTATITFNPIAKAAVKQSILIEGVYKSQYVKAPKFKIEADSNIAAPTISNLRLEGTAKVRETIEAVYDYADAGNNKELSSTYKWYTFDGTDYTLIPGVHAKSIFITTNLEGKQIACEVTPQNFAFAQGTAVKSPVSATIAAQTDAHRTDFMVGNYGLSHHFLPNYLPYLQGLQTNQDWDRVDMTLDQYIADFNVEDYVKQVKSTGAKFVVITMNQHGGDNIAPNPFYDAMIGAEPGDNSTKRDLFGQIATALKAENIKVIMYLMGFGPGKASLDAYDAENPHGTDEWGDMRLTYNMGIYPRGTGRNNTSLGKWYESVRYWSEKYGTLLDGYWLDGGGYSTNDADKYNQWYMLDALKAGNKDRIVSGAGGFQGTEYIDYSYGENPKFDREDYSNWPTNRFDRTAGKNPYCQWWGWKTLGNQALNVGWGMNGSITNRHSDTNLYNWSKRVFEVGGSMTYDLFVNRFGEIDPHNMLQVQRIREAFTEVRGADVKAGKKMLLVEDRKTEASTAQVDITDIVKSNGAGTYNISGFYKMVTGTTNDRNKVKFTIEHTKSGTTTKKSSAITDVKGLEFTEVSSAIDLSNYADGDTVILKLLDNTLEGKDRADRVVFGRPFYIDELSIKKNGTELFAAGNMETDISAFVPNAASTCKISAVYGAPTGEKSVISISLDTANAKKTYEIGDTFDKTGIQLTAIFDDNSSETVSDYEVVGFDNTTSGTQTITLNYCGKIVTFDITMTLPTKEISSISAVNTKTGYLAGEDLDTSKITVTATYADGTTVEIPAEHYVVSGYESQTSGEKTVKITYRNKTAEFKVTVAGFTAKNITEVMTADDAKFIHTNLANKPALSTSSTPHFIGSWQVDAGAGSGVYYDVYMGTPSTFNVSSIYGRTANNSVSMVLKVSDLQGNVLVSKDMAFAQINSSNDKDFQSRDFGTINLSSLKPGNYRVSLTRANTTNAYINLVSMTLVPTTTQKTLSSLVVDDSAATKSFTVGDTFSAEGLKVYAKYSDNSQVEISGATFSGFENATAGTKTVTVHFGGMTATYEVTVSSQSSKTLQSISVDTTNAKTLFKKGSTFDKTGLVVTAHYSDDSTETITDFTTSGFDSSANAKNQVITVTYEDKTVTYTVSIYTLGDLDEDGKVTATDLVTLRKLILGLETKDSLNDCQYAAANVDGSENTTPNAADLVKLRKYILGLETL